MEFCTGLHARARCFSLSGLRFSLALVSTKASLHISLHARGKGQVLMLAFCTRCWLEINADDTVCAHCGAEVNDDPRSYDEKLKAALHHPLPPARARICWVLGRRGDASAIPHLLHMLDDEDVYVQIAALKALGRIGDGSVLAVLEEAAGNPSLIIRLAASQALADVRRNTGVAQHESH